MKANDLFLLKVFSTHTVFEIPYYTSVLTSGKKRIGSVFWRIWRTFQQLKSPTS